MILTSTVVMYFLMFVNVSEFAHIYLSQTRVYMAILMGAIMAIIMMGFMWKMYDNKKLNTVIMGLSVLLVVGSFGLIQNQVGVDDTAWMRAMIPHHSTAIMTSENASLTDSRAQQLSEEIIQAQEEEIAESTESAVEPGEEVTLEARHMEGMEGATATIDDAVTSTVYMVDYQPTDGGEVVRNHKWLTEEELGQE